MKKLEEQEIKEEQNEIINDENSEAENKTEAEILEEKIEKLENELALARADFYNYRQRTIKERMEIRQRTQEDTIKEFLPVLDNLDRALNAADSEDVKSIIKGVEMVQRQFINVLGNLGVSVIETQGENFDPALHDAAGTEEIDNPELDGKVITERLKGYKANGRILRPSQVTVGKFVEKETEKN